MVLLGNHPTWGCHGNNPALNSVKDPWIPNDAQKRKRHKQQQQHLAREAACYLRIGKWRERIRHFSLADEGKLSLEVFQLNNRGRNDRICMSLFYDRSWNPGMDISSCRSHEVKRSGELYNGCIIGWPNLPMGLTSQRESQVSCT